MSQFAKCPAETPKDADELFGSFVVSQLRKMTAEQNAIAKFQINQLCFSNSDVWHGIASFSIQL